MRRQIARRDFGRVTGAMALGLITANAKTSNEHFNASQSSQGSLTDVPGIKVGHFTDSRSPTGCTAIIFEQDFAVGVDFDGSALADYQVVMLQPTSPIQKINAIFLPGGASLGLAASTGVVKWLQEQKIGHVTAKGTVYPIIVGSVIWDLEIGRDYEIHPDAEAGYKACQAASTNAVPEGNVGVGAGATVGKLFLPQGIRGMKAGVGTASLRAGDVVVGALAVANSVGNILDWRNGKVVAGARSPDGKGFVDVIDTIRKNLSQQNSRSQALFSDPALQSTAIAVLATNVDLTKTELTKLAMMGSTGAARAINPYHTPGDGDCTYAVSTGQLKSNVPLAVIGTLAAEAVSMAFLRSALRATSIEGWPAWIDYVR